MAERPVELIETMESSVDFRGAVLTVKRDEGSKKNSGERRLVHVDDIDD